MPIVPGLRGGECAAREPAQSESRERQCFPIAGPLGIARGPTGECTIAEARSALLRARNGRVDRYVREHEVVHGAPSGRGDGAVELRPIRAWIRGLSVERLAGYVERLEALVRSGGTASASRLLWY